MNIFCEVLFNCCLKKVLVCYGCCMVSGVEMLCDGM